jgi:hypothetical protein
MQDYIMIIFGGIAGAFLMFVAMPTHVTPDQWKVAQASCVKIKHVYSSGSFICEAVKEK